MTNKNFLTIIFIAFSFLANAQSNFFPQLKNVSFTGIDQSNLLSLNYEHQFTIDKIRVINHTFSDFQLQSKNEKLSFGFGYQQNLSGFLAIENYKFKNGFVAASYKLFEKEKLNIRLGTRISLSDLNYETIGSIPAYNNTILFQQIGVSQHYKNYYIAYQLGFQYNDFDGLWHKLNFGYNFNIASNFRFQPEILLETSGANFNTAQVNLNFILKDRIWLKFGVYEYSDAFVTKPLRINEIEILAKSKNNKYKFGVSINKLNANFNNYNANLKFSYNFNKSSNDGLKSKLFF